MAGMCQFETRIFLTRTRIFRTRKFTKRIWLIYEFIEERVFAVSASVLQLKNEYVHSK